MRLARTILPPATALLMFGLLPIDGLEFRQSWQIAALLAAGLFFANWISCPWRAAFFMLALLQAAWHPLQVLGWISLLTMAVFLAAIEGYARIGAAKILNWLAAGALIMCLWIGLQKAGLLTRFAMSDPAGPFNPDAGGIFLALCLPAFLRPRWWLLLPAVVAALALTRTTTAAVAAAAAVIVWGLAGGRKLILAAGLPAVLLLGVFVWQVDPLARTLNCTRWIAWRHVIAGFSSAPLGRGLGSFAGIFPVMTAGDRQLADREHGAVWRQAHNEYLQTGFEMGLQAVVLIAGFLCVGTLRLWRGRKKLSRPAAIAAAGLAATAVGAAGFHIFHIAPLALIGCAWLGMYQRLVMTDC